MLVAVCSVKGAPGATTSCFALAAAWPTPALVVEADPLGASLPLRLQTDHHARLAETPTVLTLASAARTERAEAVARAVHPINAQVGVVPGVLSPERLSGIVDWEPMARALAGSSSSIFVDVGQLHLTSLAIPLAVAADVLVPVVRPELESLVRLREGLPNLITHLARLRGAPPRVWPVLVTRSRTASRDLEDLRALLSESPAAPFVVGSGALMWDPAAIARLMAGEDPASWVGRSALMRSARQITGQLAEVVTDEPSDGPAPVPATTSDAAVNRRTVHDLLSQARRG